MFPADKNNDYYSICENISEEFGKNYYYCPLNFKDSKNVWLER